MYFNEFRARLLNDVYSLLADLIDWSDQFLLAKPINPDEKYKKLVRDLIQAIKVSRNKLNYNNFLFFL